MSQVPYPLGGAEDFDSLKNKVWELIRQLYEEKLAGCNIGDVFQDSGGVFTLRLSTTGGLEKSSNQVKIKLDGTSLTLSSSGLKVGQSAHIADPSGGGTQDAEARTAIVAILALLEERGLMASS